MGPKNLVQINCFILINYYFEFRAEAERLAAERLLEEAKALIEDAKIRVDKDEVEVRSQNGNYFTLNEFIF